MRFSCYRTVVFLCYASIASLILSSFQTIFEVTRHNNIEDQLEFEDRMQKTFQEIDLDSDVNVIKSDDQRYFQPLSDTNGSWTMFDIRKGKPSKVKEILGVIEANFGHNEIVDSDQIVPSSENRSLKSHILVYNRVPKCASTTMQNILRHLSWKNKFYVEKSPIYWR